MGEDKNTPFSVRMEQEDKEKLLKLMEESNCSTNKDFMNVLMSAYTLNKVKVEVPEASESIKKVEELTQLINDYFVNMSKQIKTSKEVLNLQFTKDLEVYKSKLDSLNDGNNKMSAELDLLKSAYNNVCNDNLDYKKQMEQLRENLQDKTSLVEEYKGKNDMILSQLKQYEKYPAQLEEYKKLLGYSQTEVMDLQNTLKDKARDIKTIEDKCNALLEAQKTQQAEFKNILAAEIEQHKSEINQMREKEEFNKEKALLDKEKEHQTLINKINVENNEKVKELLHENQEYNSKFSNLMEESQKKTGEINHLKDVIEKLMAEDRKKTNENK